MKMRTQAREQVDAAPVRPGRLLGVRRGRTADNRNLVIEVAPRRAPWRRSAVATAAPLFPLLPLIAQRIPRRTERRPGVLAAVRTSPLLLAAGVVVATAVAAAAILRRRRARARSMATTGFAAEHRLEPPAWAGAPRGTATSSGSGNGNGNGNGTGIVAAASPSGTDGADLRGPTIG